MSGSHWVKPAGATYTPRRLVSVVVRAVPVTGESARGAVALGWGGASAVASCWTKRGWTERVGLTFDTPDSLHDWIEGRATDRNATWVVSPVASQSLTLSRFWDRLDLYGAVWSGRSRTRDRQGEGRPDHTAESGGRLPGSAAEAASAGSPPATYQFSRCVLNGKPDIIKYSVKGKTLTWVSGINYLPLSEEGLAGSLGFLWPRSGGPVPSGSVVLRDTADRAELWMLAFQRLFDWWRDIDGGPWAYTVGGLSLSFFRRRLKPKTVLSHSDDRARELEERALFGGRATTWYYGTVGDYRTPGPDGTAGPPRSPYGAVPGPVELWDVSSMYPTILRDKDFPTKLLHHWPAPSVSFLGELLDQWCVIASVRLRTDRPEYPTRDGDRVSFPVGEFDAVLCGPELAFALKCGHVLSCYQAASYVRGRPWQTAADELIALRRDYDDRGDLAWGTFVKLLSNNFGGKMAQRKKGWARRPGVPAEKDWGAWREVMPDGSLGPRYVALAGLVWEVTDPSTPVRPLAAQFAYLTAHGRALMRDVRATLPPGRVVSQDTDGVWVLDPTEAERRRAVRFARRVGFRLRRDRRASAGRWLGPRHYWTPDGWVLAGVSDPGRWVDGRSCEDRYSINPIHQSCNKPPSVVYDYRRRINLDQMPADGPIGADGWVSPRVLGPHTPYRKS